ncbi:hypothetical protein BmHG_00129 [Borrelia miyamotoi]|uniref:hypothetical protein n=1 Tax=Borrelia miyamotoi TaxID=47466 RepID=UPI0003E35DE3|nr:hypothetical protein [Borrelia miyamotoi]AHH05291.1 Hypothetical protein BOM_0748 [Borrelia miyamotoi FR64b]QBK63473.1 hypothetical protein EZU68_03620 [Borrelia miyamotoi]BCR08536.1 hypothetical protein BmHH_00127 [Borrelia miyamotoi]BCR09365.1 hypothetical protein BmHG_00129 [Borrelia miyamotoi]BCR10195.1 hypothetical protein BmHF_00128 [Borrelia miyamotoi]
MVTFFLHLILTNILISFIVSFFVVVFGILKFRFLLIYLVSFLGGVLFLFFLPLFYFDYYNRQINILFYLFPIVGSIVLIFLLRLSESNKNDL